MSKVYFARPVTLSGPSRRLTDVPRTARLRRPGELRVGRLRRRRGRACPPAGALRIGAGSATPHPLHARHRFEDARERAAAADVAVEALPDLLGRRVRMLLEQRRRSP